MVAEIISHIQDSMVLLDRDECRVGFHCMFLVVLITGCAVHEEDLKQFGQWNSRTPGHPENFETPGVEVTTGKLPFS